MGERVYTCAICGKGHASVAQRMNCEQVCLKKREEEEKKAAEAKKAAEFDARLTEVNAAFDKAYALRDKLVADYGEYYYYHKFNSLEDVFKHLFGVQ